MNKIEELLKNLCPNGVEYKKLWNVTEWDKKFNGTTKEQQRSTCKFNHISANELKSLEDNSGKIKLLSTGNYDGYTTEEKAGKNINSGEIFTIPSGGTANIKYYNGLFIDSGNIIGKSNDVNKYSTKYIYYWLLNNYIEIQSFFRGSGVKHPDMVSILNMSIPVPPLEVQCEIVHILDDFTLLSAELSAELKARQKQYEYYNCNLLKFENIPYYTLEELCDIVDYRGKTPKKTNEGIFLVTAKNIRKGYIDYEKSQEFISEQDYAEVMRRGMPKVGDVLITTEAPCGNVAQVDDENIALAQRVIKYRPKDNRLDSTFLKYILLGEEFQTKLNGKATGGTVKGIKGSILHKLTIPLPSIEEQRKIVKILDRFNKLCNDISEGLPAEINARQKQYEYYRDKILTFKMIGD